MSAPRRPANAARWPDILLTITGAAGIAVVFLPFTYGTVPLTDVMLDDIAHRDWQLWLMVLPCVALPFLVTAGQVARLTGRWSPRLSRTAVAAASVLALPYLGAIVQDMAEYQWVLVAGLSVAAYGAGVWLLVSGIRRDSAAGGLVAMQVTYLVPMSFWIGFASDDFEIGAVLGTVTAAAYLVQLGRVAKWPASVLALALPIAALALYA